MAGLRHRFGPTARHFGGADSIRRIRSMGGAGDGTDTAMPRQFHEVCGFGEDFRRHRFWPEADFFWIAGAAVFLEAKLKNKALGLPGRAYSKGGSEGFPDLKLPAIADSKLPILASQQL